MGKSRQSIGIENSSINRTEYEEYPYEYKGEKHKLYIKELNINNEEDWQTFVETLKKAKQQYIDKENPDEKGDGWRVETDISKEDYKDAKLYITENGSTLAIKSDGDIAAVCSVPSEPKGSGISLLQYAVEHGGTKLDSFSGNHGFYTKAGFKPVSWIKWDKGYEDHMVEQGWKPGIDKQEPIIFYKFDPVGAKKYENTKPRYFTNRSVVSENIVDDKGEITKYAYDVAYEKRDDDIMKK